MNSATANGMSSGRCRRAHKRGGSHQTLPDIWQSRSTRHPCLPKWPLEAGDVEEHVVARPLSPKVGPMCGPVTRRYGITDVQSAAMRAWAEADLCVEELRVFGSRARGRARIDSDLDIAITASDGNYTRFDADWEKQISEVTGLRARVSQYNCSVDDTVRRYGDDCSVLLFHRPLVLEGFKRPGGKNNAASRGELGPVLINRPCRQGAEMSAFGRKAE
jgi:predicted nucleotidyltransferase